MLKVATLGVPAVSSPTTTTIQRTLPSLISLSLSLSSHLICILWIDGGQKGAVSQGVGLRPRKELRAAQGRHRPRRAEGNQ